MYQLGKLQYHLGQLYVKYNWPIWLPPIQTQKEQAPTENKKEDESCILEQLDLGEIRTWSVDSSKLLGNYYVIILKLFQKMIWIWENVDILKHDIQLTDSQPFKERYRRIPPHLFEEVKTTPPRDVGGRDNQEKL